MKTLMLIAITALSIHAQSLISADGVKWQYVGGLKEGDESSHLYVKLPYEKSKTPRLTVKFWDGPESVVSLDCKRKMFRANDEEWVKAPPKTLGGILLKFACKK